MQPLKILIVEDNVTIAMELEDCLTELGYVVCGKARNDKKAIEIFEQEKPDLVFMDVELAKGSIDGIKLTKVLKKIDDFPVIYLTAFYENAEIRKRAFSTKPQSFLLKPQDLNITKLSIEIELAIKNHYSQKRADEFLLKHFDDRSFFLKQNKRMLKVHYHEIVYFQARGESTFIYLEKGEQRLIFATGLGKTLDKLDKSFFIRTHRSYAVNANKIHSYTSSSNEKKKYIYLNYQDKQIDLPLSDKYRTNLINYHPRLTS